MYNRERKTLGPTDESGRPCVRELTIVIAVTPSSSVYPSATTSVSARSKRAQIVLWPCHTQVGGMKETGPYCQRRRRHHHHRSICFFMFLFFSRFTISIRSFHPFLLCWNIFSVLVCCCCCCCLFGVGWLISFGFFFFLFFGVFVMGRGRDPLARLSVHLTLAFCLVCLCPVPQFPYPLRSFFLSTPLLGCPSR